MMMYKNNVSFFLDIINIIPIVDLIFNLTDLWYYLMLRIIHKKSKKIKEKIKPKWKIYNSVIPLSIIFLISFMESFKKKKKKKKKNKKKK